MLAKVDFRHNPGLRTTRFEALLLSAYSSRRDDKIYGLAWPHIATRQWLHVSHSAMAVASPPHRSSIRRFDDVLATAPAPRVLRQRADPAPVVRGKCEATLNYVSEEPWHRAFRALNPAWSTYLSSEPQDLLRCLAPYATQSTAS